jgi:hypothetical protein
MEREQFLEHTIVSTENPKASSRPLLEIIDEYCNAI